MQQYCDLHTHSIFSDGTDTPQEILQAAVQCGLSAVALCDHNTTDGLLHFLNAAKDLPIEAICGAEFSVDYNGTELHLLGLFLDPKHYPQIMEKMAKAHQLKEQSNLDLIKALNAAGYPLDYQQIKGTEAGHILEVADQYRGRIEEIGDSIVVFQFEDILESFLPETAKKIADQMNTELRAYEELSTFGLYESGAKVTDKPEILFARLDLKEVMPKVEEIQAAQKAEYEAEQARIARVMGVEAPVTSEDKEEKKEMEATLVGEHKAEIEYADFDKCEFRVGEVVECKEVPKSKKLLCSQVKVGDKTVQILSGIKAQYSPEEMVGKKVMVLLNLKPVTMAGLQSEGMILCAEDCEGNLSLMTPEKDFHAGSEIC